MLYEHGVLLVEAMRGIWLDGEAGAFGTGTGLVSFEARGLNDATVVFSSEPFLTRMDICKREVYDGTCASSSNDDEHCSEKYVIILGSHRNTKLKICQGRRVQALLDNVPEACLHAQQFKSFWVNLGNDSLAIGCGPPGCCTLYKGQRQPSASSPGRLFIGFLSWDARVALRNVMLEPALGQPSCMHHALIGPERPIALRYNTGVSRSLLTLCMQSLQQALLPEHAIAVLLTLMALLREHEPLWPAAISALAQGFESVMAASPDAFCELPFRAVLATLTSATLCASEGTIFKAVEAWAYGEWPRIVDSADHSIDGGPDADDRVRQLAHDAEDVATLVKLVRYPQMSREELEYVTASELAAALPVVHQLVAESCVGAPPSTLVEHGKSLLRGSELRRLWRLQRRCPPYAHELVYMHDGDRNGVLYYLGTALGKRPHFINPQRSGLVSVSSSSPFYIASEPSRLVGRDHQRNTVALPNSASETFWIVDFKQTCTLSVTHYSMRMNGCGACPRSWALQGSNGGAWVTIHEVLDDTTFQTPGQFGSFTLNEGHHSSFFASTRLLLTGPTSQGTRELNINWIEFYGYLAMV